MKVSKQTQIILNVTLIFDDMDDYFPKIKDFIDTFGFQIQLSLIDNESSWNFFF